MIRPILQNDRFIDEFSDIVVSLTLPKYMDEQRKKRHWLKFVNRATVYENRMRRDAGAIFRDMRDEMLGRMPAKAVESDVEDWIFEKGKWRIRFEEMGQLLLPGIIEEVGSDEMATLIVGVGFDVTNPRVSDFVAERTFKFAGDVTNTTYEAVRSQLLAGIAEGEGIPKLRKRIESVFENAGRVRSEMIARSEIIRASNFGAEEAYKQSGVVSGKEWLTAFDERTCDQCAAMNGKIVELGRNYFEKGDEFMGLKLDYEDVGYPPLHVKCRCTIVAVLR
jgi:SPP1 gp7 family putative phage head morphogenesis protein